MKAILVIDIPDDIWANKEEDLGMYAEVWSRKVGDGWCGEYYSSCLKPMPQKNKGCLNYADGWNDCLNEITGEYE